MEVQRAGAGNFSRGSRDPADTRRVRDMSCTHGNKGGGGCCCDSGDGCGCGCCCSGEGGFRRRYQTRAEQIAELSEYLKELKAEVQAVQERLDDLKRKK
jgi:hypothetical protein